MFSATSVGSGVDTKENVGRSRLEHDGGSSQMEFWCYTNGKAFW